MPAGACWHMGRVTTRPRIAVVSPVGQRDPCHTPRWDDARRGEYFQPLAGGHAHGIWAPPSRYQERAFHGGALWEWMAQDLMPISNGAEEEISGRGARWSSGSLNFPGCTTTRITSSLYRRSNMMTNGRKKYEAGLETCCRSTDNINDRQCRPPPSDGAPGRSSSGIRSWGKAPKPRRRA